MRYRMHGFADAPRDTLLTLLPSPLLNKPLIHPWNGDVALHVSATLWLRVCSGYVPHRSNPSKNQFFFLYKIRIQNVGKEVMQLKGRVWNITDAEGNLETVRFAACRLATACFQVFFSCTWSDRETAACNWVSKPVAALLRTPCEIDCWGVEEMSCACAHNTHKFRS